ncbi:MafI family immunity protein [Amycolatopsis sp. Poz14]|uniref:MafI family immunity protein n=1 Tax=Amycolatopsis sp. Poz14 TaxID=1447705 RepID=UPI001EE7F83E|nr:MafI family immunity protein [Amycolatopsis sp. Poz14]MCG3749122.1 MafI family immunity protein [Amycolatopsis sp. Poz14]
MTEDRSTLYASWDRTRRHLAAARADISDQPDVDLSIADDFIEHNEFGLAFDCLVEIGDDVNARLAFWRALDEAAREMGMYEEPRSGSARLCLERLAAAE